MFPTFSKEYSFCNQTLPQGLRVSSGSYTYIELNYICLASADAVTQTPRMDIDSDNMHNIRVSLELKMLFM